MRKMRKPKFEMKYFPMTGGDDLSSPSLSVDPGRTELTLNYELDSEFRYKLIDGYERFDGQTKPSEAVYYMLWVDACDTEIEIDDVVEGGTSGATGTVIDVKRESGTHFAGDWAGRLALIDVSATAFIDGEDIEVSSVKHAEANGAAVLRGSDSDTMDSIYMLGAQAAARDDIAAVPGSGAILGVWQYNGVVYAFRNNSGATAAVMHKSTATGWEECDLGEVVGFSSGGTYEIQEEDDIEGATSGATATVKRIVLESGTWAGGDAAGRLYLANRTGSFQAENLDVGANSDVATIPGFSTPVTLAAGGRYEFINHNFVGHLGETRMYGVDGEGMGFEWDGSVFVQIDTGMDLDEPTHLVAHKGHLFYAFAGGSLQHSSTGLPYSWSVVTGAGEIGMGDEITGLLSMPNVLAIFCRNSTYLLYGTGISDWELRQHSQEVGAIEWTIQKIGTGIYLDDRGITSLATSDRYGDFLESVLSKKVDTWIKQQKTLAVASVRVRAKSQYRLFFSDKTAITMTMFEGKYGFARQRYDHVVSCVCSVENTDGYEELYFGSDNGMVYQLDSGQSFDGDALEAVIRLRANHLQLPTVKKRIRKIHLELAAPVSTFLSASIDYNYGETDGGATVFNPEPPGGIWEVDDWDNFVWDGRQIASLPIYTDGTALNFSLVLYHSGVWELSDLLTGSPYQLPYSFLLREGITGARPHTIQGYVVHYDIRGVQR
jgi:hypothetical protein